MPGVISERLDTTAAQDQGGPIGSELGLHSGALHLWARDVPEQGEAYSYCEDNVSTITDTEKLDIESVEVELLDYSRPLRGDQENATGARSARRGPARNSAEFRILNALEHRPKSKEVLGRVGYGSYAF